MTRTRQLLLQYSDMPTEMGAEAVEIITMAVDKFQAKKNYEVGYADDYCSKQYHP